MTRKGLRKPILSAVCLAMLAAVLINMAGCSFLAVKAQAVDLTKGISARVVTGKAADEKFIVSAAGFFIELFKKTAAGKDNALVSPLSVLLALAMTANGAGEETLAQMEAVLGRGISLDDLNEYLYAYANSLPAEEKAKLGIANSIWFRDDENRLIVEQDFLQKNADYYGAAAYKAAFDEETVKDINNWVSGNTGGLIESILDAIDEDTVMYLINAIVFDAEWQAVYNKDGVRDRAFTDMDGSAQTVPFMHSEESLYVEGEGVTGFIKPYANDRYSFLALLPDKGVSVHDYIASLSGEGFLSLVKGAQNTAVAAALPKFSYDYTVRMNDALKALGMPDAFFADAADFTRIGRSPRGNLYIGEVLHKTYIAVDELGTKAGAVTKVEIKDEAFRETKVVTLDRPFVYAIIDNGTGLPVFIGTVVTMA